MINLNENKMMKLYNTLSKQIEEIKPINPPIVSIYTCGPTVYDYPHIGNWFTFIRYDLLVRTLKMNGYQPKWVMNITDVGHLVSDADEGEDKLEKGARREGKTAWDIAKYYGDYFVKGLERLNITQPDFLPKATEHINEQIELIKKLEDKGFTYKIDDGIYYDTSKFPKYADFAELDIDEQQTGKRVDANTQKRQATDFALWKFSPKGQKRDMEWDSPWGKGFPGWHIECSAMSMKYLGETMDIHAGGLDHIPIHHTNEIAQSEGATGKQFSKYWMHTNHILIDNEKISKSLGNTLTLEDIESKGYSLEAFRLLVLQSHYRSQSKFSWEDLEAASNRLKNIKAFADLRYQKINNNGSKGNYDTAISDIKAAMESDLETPHALRSLAEVEDTVKSFGISAANYESFSNYLKTIDEYFGLNLLKSVDINDQQKSLIVTREQLRKQAKSASSEEASDIWNKTNEIRDNLSEQGIGLRDTEYGTIWFRL